ncbi:MAG: type II toxin-antitoxin system RelE/ParE family toxin [Bacteroidales bacterium]|nr:type II toxin-antitoxin system RelE/ParE family toxin [Bacteroidales bacterium]
MSQFEYVLLDSAEDDLDETFIWYELHKQGLGVEFILEVEKTFLRISQFPLAAEKNFENTFRLVMRKFPYSIYYRIDLTTFHVHILGVLHHKRNPKTLKDRM